MDDFLQGFKLDPAFGTPVPNSDNILDDPLEGHRDFLTELFSTSPVTTTAAASSPVAPTPPLTAPSAHSPSPQHGSGGQHGAATVHPQLPPRIPAPVPIAHTNPSAPPTGTVEAAPAIAATPRQPASASMGATYSSPNAPGLNAGAHHPHAASAAPRHGASGPRTTATPPQREASLLRQALQHSHALSVSSTASRGSSSPGLSTPATTPSPLQAMSRRTVPQARYGPSTTPHSVLDPRKSVAPAHGQPETSSSAAPTLRAARSSRMPRADDTASLPAVPSWVTPEYAAQIEAYLLEKNQFARALAPLAFQRLEVLKRGRSDDSDEAGHGSRGDAALSAKRPSTAEAWQERSTLDLPLAQSNEPVGRNVQSHNNELPQESSHVPAVDGALAAPLTEEDNELIEDEFTHLFDGIVDEDQLGDDTVTEVAGEEDDSDTDSLFDDEEGAAPVQTSPVLPAGEGMRQEDEQSHSLALPGGGLQLPGQCAGPAPDGRELLGLTALEANFPPARPAPSANPAAKVHVHPQAGPSQQTPPPPPSGKNKKPRKQAGVQAQPVKTGERTPAKEETPAERAQRARSNAVVLKAALGTRYPWMTDATEAGPASTAGPSAAPTPAGPQPATPAGGAPQSLIPATQLARAAPNVGTQEQRAALDPKGMHKTTGPAPLDKSQYCDICWQRGQKGIWFNDRGLRDHMRKATSPGHPKATST